MTTLMTINDNGNIVSITIEKKAGILTIRCEDKQLSKELEDAVWELYKNRQQKRYGKEVLETD